MNKKFNEKYFDANNTTATPIKDAIEGSDNPASIYKPNKKAFVLSRTIKMLPIAIIWILFDTVALILMTSNEMLKGETFLIVVIIAFAIIHLIPVWIWIFNIIKALKQVKYEEYSLTTDTIVVKTGDSAVNLKLVKYTDIISVTVNRSLTDKLLKVGDVVIITDYREVTLHDLPNYNEVATAIHKKSVVAYEEESYEEFPPEE